mmetsp:Transcript_11975/g.27330  ORF Transcript_11975/g.27330 Transcript_11975/m.27330 type:complete len:609 (+) Transcript_11975:18-1844(+)
MEHSQSDKPPLLRGSPLPVGDLFHCNFSTLQDVLLRITTAINDLQDSVRTNSRQVAAVECSVQAVKSDISQLDTRSAVSQLQLGLQGLSTYRTQTEGRLNGLESRHNELEVVLRRTRNAQAPLVGQIDQLASSQEELSKKFDKVAASTSRSLEAVDNLDKAVESLRRKQDACSLDVAKQRTVLDRVSDTTGVAELTAAVTTTASRVDRLWCDVGVVAARQSELSKLISEQSSDQAALAKTVAPLASDMAKARETMAKFENFWSGASEQLAAQVEELLDLDSRLQDVEATVEPIWEDFQQRELITIDVDESSLRSVRNSLAGPEEVVERYVPGALPQIVEHDGAEGKDDELGVGDRQRQTALQGQRLTIMPGRVSVLTDVGVGDHVVKRGSELLQTQRCSSAIVVRGRQTQTLRMIFRRPQPDGGVGQSVFQELRSDVQDLCTMASDMTRRLGVLEIRSEQSDQQLHASGVRLEELCERLRGKADMGAVDSRVMEWKQVGGRMGQVVQDCRKVEGLMDDLSLGTERVAGSILSDVREMAMTLVRTIEEELHQTSIGVKCLVCSSRAEPSTHPAEICADWRRAGAGSGIAAVRRVRPQSARNRGMGAVAW